MDMKVANDADLKAWRKAQRAELLARRNAVPEAQRRQWNAQLTQLLSEAFPAPSWMTVGFYWPFQGEFDPRFVIRRLRRFGARAALPERFAHGRHGHLCRRRLAPRPFRAQLRPALQLPTEQFKLNFTEILWTYNVQLADMKTLGKVTTGWSLAHNRPIAQFT